MHDARLTVRLPEHELNFARKYAATHGVTVTELVLRYFRSLRAPAEQELHPEVQALIGALPAKLDARAAYRSHAARKHG